MDGFMKILIAEDDLTSRTLLQALLTQWGYEVISTCDGNEALAALQGHDAPQLAVLDWEMPGMDGVELCKELRRQERKYPLYLILLTSRGQRGDIVQGLEAGADDYVAKPYDDEELRARVNVGRRMVELQNTLRQKDKLQGVLEIAGAVCHEINQPLQAVSGLTELLLLKIEESNPCRQMLKNIQIGVERIGRLTRKMMNISKYRSKAYMGGKRMIVDIDQASAPEDQLN
jgi:phosphoserine phosphatase RsbU/P